MYLKENKCIVTQTLKWWALSKWIKWQSSVLTICYKVYAIMFIIRYLIKNSHYLNRKWLYKIISKPCNGLFCAPKGLGCPLPLRFGSPKFKK